MERVDGGFAAPALATHLAAGGRETRGNSVGQLLTQIKIAADAVLVDAIEPEHGLRVVEINPVLDLTALADTCGVVESQIHRQTLQKRKLVREPE